jgi:TruD family tRNA pseudouridine synthase
MSGAATSTGCYEEIGISSDAYTYMNPSPSAAARGIAPARIKERPEDFIVYEIMHSHVASGTHEAPPATAFSAPNEAKSDGSDACKLKFEPPSCTASAGGGGGGGTATPSGGCSEFSGFDEGTLGALMALERGATTEPVLVPVSAQNSREERVQVHRAIVEQFLFIRTRTVSQTLVQCEADDRLRPCVGIVADANLKELRHFMFTPPGQSSATCPSTAKAASLFIPISGGKVERTLVHRTVTAANPALITHALGDGIEATWSRKRKCQQKRDPSSPKTYVGFCLKKVGWEHHAAVDALSRALSCPPSALSWAGMKDKMAVTFQLLVAEGASVADVERARTLLPGGLSISPATTVSGPLVRGSNLGNRFDLCLRHMQCSPNSSQPLLRAGFVNFFGAQRVGMGRTSSSWRLGQELLRGDFRAAALLILEGGDLRDVEGLDEEDLLARFRQRDGNGRARFRSKWASALLRELIRMKLPLQWQRAVEKLPHVQRTMWANAYQARLWNSMACLRLERYPARPLMGDIVFVNGGVRELSSAADLATGEYALADIAVPLPGCNVSMYPSHSMAEAFRDAMQADGTWGALQPSSARPKFAVKGGYRRLICVPSAVEWSTAMDDTDGYCGRVCFDLASGCFATMALRELTGSNMSLEWEWQQEGD